jgi:hypothetical protein
MSSFAKRTALAVCVLGVALACRDAPTEATEVEGVAAAPGIPAFAILPPDTVEEAPPMATIHWAYTEIDYYDGRQGGQSIITVIAEMEYTGNRASHETSFRATSPTQSIYQTFTDDQATYFNLWFRNKFRSNFFVTLQKYCDLTLEAHTKHQAWWDVFIPRLPMWRDQRYTTVSQAPSKATEPCPYDDDGGPGNGSSSGSTTYLTIETCYYWAYWENGQIVSIELDYCETTTVPLNEE